MSEPAGEPRSEPPRPVSEPASEPESTARRPAGRGTTRIGPSVARKIAQRAATEVDGVAGTMESRLSRLVPWVHGDGPVDVDADVGVDDVHIDLSISVRYPEPAGRVAGAVRAHVSDRLSALTGLRVSRIDITVENLAVAPGHAPAARVE